MKAYFIFITCVVLLSAFPTHAHTIQPVTNAHGLHAWLVEDHKLPLVTMRFAFRGGIEQDPIDKQGLANLTMEMLTQGAADKNAETFQRTLSKHSITIRFEAGRDALHGYLKTLTTERAQAIGLLHDALTQPRFNAIDIERLRGQQLAALKAQMENPGWQARYAMFQTIFKDHPYGERRYGSTETLAQITRDDIQTFAKHHLAQDNLVIAVAGDITANDLTQMLDDVFGDLPNHAHLTDVPEVSWPDQTAVVLVPREGTQTELLFAMPGPKRDDKDYYAAEIANYIIGSGGFSSRLMQDVRDKKGLTYGISTTLSPMDHAGLIAGGAAVDNPKAGAAWRVAEDTMQKFYEGGAMEIEITAAKDYLTGSLPLTMTSTDKIAAALVGLQLDGLGIDFLDRYNDLIRSVTPEAITETIHRWFNPAGLSLVMVGMPEGIESSGKREQIKQ
jgi:zinc protease